MRPQAGAARLFVEMPGAAHAGELKLAATRTKPALRAGPAVVTAFVRVARPFTGRAGLAQPGVQHRAPRPVHACSRRLARPARRPPRAEPELLDQLGLVVQRDAGDLEVPRDPAVQRA